ncbi:MAG TPA: Uma2 family endonuclease [Bryobacterales bacterium]|nr:Uma2 family endonuclease [Bryobacterales bacterium]
MEQLEKLPANDLRHELDEGELITMSPAARRHGKMQVRISRLLSEFVDRNRLGEVVTEVGFILSRDPGTVRAPDVAFIRAGRPETSTGFEEGAPDLAVEIVSPSDAAFEMVRKVNQYLRAGARAVWVVYPEEKQVHVFDSTGTARILDAAQTLSAPELLPGFSVPLSALFE